MSDPQLSEATIRALQTVADGRSLNFNARQLADELTAETPFAQGGAGLYVYEDGTYKAGAKRNIERRIAVKLGDDWKSRRAAEAVAYISATAPELWDAPRLDHINLRNGLLDLGDSSLESHTPDFLSPLRIPVTYDPAAECPAIDKFLGEILDPELRELVYELAGYLVTADNSLQVAVMLLGTGANGKSSLLNLLTALVGEVNVSNVALHRLDEDKFAAASLYGKLVNSFADLDSRALQASSIFKSVTGGDSISGERKYADPFTFRPYARLLFSANEPPPTPDNSDAFFRRWIVVPFERRFDGKRADRNLGNKLTTRSELSGLLNKGLERLPDLRMRGSFTATEASVNAAQRFRVDADSVAGFLDDQCELDAGRRTPQARLFPAYRAWCGNSNRRPLGKQRFNRRLLELAPAVFDQKSDGVRYWDGLGLARGDR
jgi:putative DNA primase/helicase